MWIEIMIFIWLLGLSLWDAKGCYVPLWLLIGGSSVIIVVALLGCCEAGDYVKWAAGILPGVILLVLGLLTRMIGYGDGVVVMALGTYVGIRECVMVLTIGMFLMAVFALVLLLIKKVKKSTRLPFLPFLTTGWLVVQIL